MQAYLGISMVYDFITKLHVAPNKSDAQQFHDILWQFGVEITKIALAQHKSPLRT